MNDRNGFYSGFGSNLAEAFERSDMSIAEAARRSEFSYNELKSWLDGYKPPIAFYKLHKLCDALDITADELFNGMVIMPPFFRDNDHGVYAISRTQKKPYQFFVVKRNLKRGWRMFYNELFDDLQSAGNFLKGKAVSNLWRKS